MDFYFTLFFCAFFSLHTLLLALFSYAFMVALSQFYDRVGYVFWPLIFFHTLTWDVMSVVVGLQVTTIYHTCKIGIV